MKYQRYETLTAEEIAKIHEMNPRPIHLVCECSIYENRPSFCKEGPLVTTRLPDCGFSFVIGDDGEIKRVGECKRCGRCCSLQRKDGSPFGFYDPNGKPCIHLRIKKENPK